MSLPKGVTEPLNCIDVTTLLFMKKKKDFESGCQFVALANVYIANASFQHFLFPQTGNCQESLMLRKQEAILLVNEPCLHLSTRLQIDLI